MDKETNIFLKLLSATVNGTVPEVECDENGWEKIYELSAKRKTLAYCSNTVAAMYKKGQVPENIWNKWSNYTQNSMKNEIMRFMEITRLLQKARQEDVRLIFFKGYLLSVLYPGFGVRNSSDVDFFIYEEQLTQVKKIMEEEYILERNDEKEHVLTYKNKQSGHTIEVHLCLWEDFTGEKMKILESFNLTQKDKIIKENVFGQEVYTMPPTEHLIYQIFHIIKHYIIDGVGIRYLLDISLFVNAHFEKIDWKYFWDAMKKMEYDEFAKQFFTLGNKYFGLKIDALPEGKIVDMEDEEVFLFDLVMAGKINENQKGWFQILGIMSPYLTGNIDKKKSTFSQRLQFIFPTAENIRPKFSYAKKHKILLPIAWVHRFIDYFCYKKKHPGDFYNIETKLSAAEYRIRQAKNRGLIK